MRIQSDLIRTWTCRTRFGIQQTRRQGRENDPSAARFIFLTQSCHRAFEYFSCPSAIKCLIGIQVLVGGFPRETLLRSRQLDRYARVSTAAFSGLRAPPFVGEEIAQRR